MVEIVLGQVPNHHPDVPAHVFKEYQPVQPPLSPLSRNVAVLEVLPALLTDLYYLETVILDIHITHQS